MQIHLHGHTHEQTKPHKHFHAVTQTHSRKGNISLLKEWSWQVILSHHYGSDGSFRK